MYLGPIVLRDWKATGKKRYHPYEIDYQHFVVLQIEEHRVLSVRYNNHRDEYRWRNAIPEDLIHNIDSI